MISYITINHQLPTIYIQNRRDSIKFNGCSPRQYRIGLTSWSFEIPASAYRHPSVCLNTIIN
jgi:hypothetical protein